MLPLGERSHSTGALSGAMAQGSTQSRGLLHEGPASAQALGTNAFFGPRPTKPTRGIDNTASTTSAKIDRRSHND